MTLSASSLIGADAGNYTLSPLNPLSANITPASLTVSGLTAANKVYDATTAASLAGTGALTGVLGADVVSLSGIATATFADKNAATAKPVTVSGLGLAGLDAINYTVVPPTGLTADITAAPLTVSGLAAQSKVYDTTTAATLTGSAALSGVFAGDAVTVAGVPSAAFGDKNVGGAKAVTVSGLRITGADQANYSLTGPTGLTADITPATVVVAGLTAGNKVYDATTAATVSGTPVLSGVLTGDVVAAAGTAAGSFADKNVGAAKPVSISGLGLTGTDAGNYVVVAGGLKASISPATLTLGGVSAADKVYDATTAATLAGSAGAVGALGTDVVTLTGAPTAAFADKNVGSAKPVSLGLGSASLSGPDAGNYVLVAPTAPLSASITPAPLLITATDQNKQQGGTFTFAGTEFIPTGLVGGEKVASVSLNSTGAVAGADFGVYPITAAGPVVAGAGFDPANYAISYRPGTMVVSPFTTPVQQQVQSQVVTFLTLFTQEALTQAPTLDENGKPKGKPDVVSTDGATCRPS